MIVLVVAVGVGARIFKNTMLSGATQANMSVKRMLFLGAVFGGIQVLMVSLGLALTWTIDNVWGMETVGGRLSDDGINLSVSADAEGAERKHTYERIL